MEKYIRKNKRKSKSEKISANAMKIIELENAKHRKGWLW